MNSPATDSVTRPIRGRGAQRPCDLCRARKARCLVNKAPPCDRCLKAGRLCTFQHEPPPRRPRVEPTVSRSRNGVDLSVQDHASSGYDLFSSFQDVGQVANGNFSLSPFNWPLFPGSPEGAGLTPPLYPTIEDPSMQRRQPLPQISNSQPNSVTSSSGTTPEHLDARISSYDAPAHVQWPEVSSEADIAAKGSGLLLGPSSEIDPFLRNHYLFDEQDVFRSSLRSFQRVLSDEAGATILMTVPRHVTDNMADTLIPDPEEPLLSEMHKYKAKLLALFNRFVYPSYMVPVQETLEHEPISPAVLAAVYALALPWRSHDPSLPWALFDKGMTRQSPPDANRLYRYVWQYVSRGMHAPSYSIVHACLLLLERRKAITFPTDSPFDACVLTSLISIAYSIGLNKDPSQWIHMDPKEKDHRKLLWWLIFIQDKWLAAATGQPTIIKQEDFDTPRPIINNSLFTVSAPVMEHNIALEETFFAHLLSLTDILGDILSNFMTLRNAARLSFDVPGTTSIAQILRQRLDVWRNSVSRTLQYISLTKPEAANGNLGALRVAYLYCEVLLHRTVLRVTQDRAEFGLHFEEAKAFLNTMSKEFQALTLSDFGQFWFSWSRAQFNTITDFFILIIVLAPTEEERASVKFAAAQHRQWLWLHIQSFEVARMSMVRLDTLLDAIEKEKLV